MKGDVCPNRNLKEWLALEEHPEIGLFEAMRDFKEHDGDIRTPEQVLKKLKDRRDEMYADQVAKKERESGIYYLPDLKAFQKEVKLTKKQVSGLQKALINDRVKAANGKLNTSFYVKFTQVGQADLYTWDVQDRSRKNFGFDEPNSMMTVAYNVSDFRNNSMNKYNTNDSRSIEIVTKLAQRLSEQVGIKYQTVTFKEAYEITKDAKNPWAGHSAFFFGDQVYFVDGGINVENAFHEFSHPLIRSIAVSNIKTFDKLYLDVISTNEGSDITQFVRDKYPELKQDEMLFKEEVLVRALTQSARNKYNQEGEPQGFIKTVQNILFHIKQLLRKVFGQKIDISKLSPETTLDQLAEMLVKGENFNIENEIINEDETVSYNKDSDAYLKDLLQVNQNDLQNLTNRFFDVVSKHIHTVKNSSDYNAMLDVLVNDFKTGDLQKMRENIKAYQTKIIEAMNNKTEDVEYDRNHAQALLNNLFILSNTSNKVQQALIEIAKDVDNKDNVQRAEYYKVAVRYWDDFITEAEQQLSANFVDLNSPLSQLVGRVKQSLNRSKDILNMIYEKGSRDILNDTLRSSAEAIDKKYTEQLALLKKKNAPQSIIDKLEREYNNAKVTSEKIDKALKGTLTDEFGKIKDASAVGSFLEGYGYNPDPVVGGLAKYVKDNMTDILVEAQSTFNGFADEMKPLLDAVGYNPNNVGKLGKDIGQEEEVGYVDDKGEFQKRKVWRFLNQFKGWDVVEDEYRYKIKKAGEKYAETGSEEDKKVLYDLQAEWRQHQQDYQHTKYIPEFYKRFELLNKDDIGKEAMMLRDNIFERMRLLSNPISSQDELEVADQIELLHRELRQLTDLRDYGGKMKTGKDLEIAKRLKEFNDLTKDFYETVEIPNGFRDALKAYEDKLISEGKQKGSENFNTMRNAWLNKNTRMVAKQEFWDKMNVISARIKELLSNIPQQQQTQLDISGAFDEIKETLTGYKDEDGQPVGGEMSDDRLEKIKAAQERILKAQEYLTSASGLSRTEQYKLDLLYNKIFEGTATKNDYAEIARLMDRKSSLSLNKFERAELRGLYAQLDQLRRKEPTDSYVDEINSWLSVINTESLYKSYKTNGIDKNTAFIMLDDNNLEPLFESSPEFEAWFRMNHIRKKTIDRDTGMEMERWERTYAWNIIRPADDQYYEKTTLKDDKGNVIEEIVGLPAMKYYKRMVKEEYLTEKIIGRTVDNRGNWLPKTMQTGARDDRYINKDHGKMRSDNPKLFSVLEKMTAYHLKNQDGLHNKAKLYLDMPRYRKEGLERLQSPNLLQRMIEAIRTFWTRIKDGYDAGFNFKDDFQLVKLDLFDDETTGVPVSGLANIDADEVSTDIAYTMMRYMMSGKRQKKLIEISPMVRAIQNVVNNQKNIPLVEKALENRTLTFLNKRKDKYIRKQAVNNFITREFEGQTNTGLLSDNIVAQNFSNYLFKKASFAYLAMNIPSAIKNAVSAKFQGMIEAAAGKYMSPQSFIKGESWATQVVGKNMFEIYKHGSKTLDLQIVEIFDPARDRFENKIGEALSRTPIKDSINVLERLSDFRKITQLQSELQTFAGMMYHHKVEQDGKWIPYMEAWELRDGKIQLKAGVDPEWGITYDADGNQKIGEKFKTKRNEMQRVLDNLNGAMGKEESPEAQRYLVFKFISYLRRWFTSMFVNRWGYSGSLWKGTSRGRVDFQLGDTKEGIYITSLKLVTRALSTGGKYLKYMTGDEKKAFIRFGTEVGTLVLMSALLPLMFDWDPDDPERYKKLRAKSGALPFFGLTEEDSSRPFLLGGWLENQALYLMLATRSENEQFIPAPGFGLDDYQGYLSMKSLSFGPTLTTYARIAQDIGYMVTGDDRAYYKRTVGAYEFQQQGANKIWSHLAKSIGLSGSSIDPAITIKNFIAAQSNLK